MARQADQDAGRGKGLSRGRIAAAAIALVEADGIDALSMRKLGATLGVEAMSLYGHVRNKHDLLVAMNDLLLGGVAATPPSEDPLQDALDFAHELRRALTAHPNTARLFTMNMTLQDSYATQVLTAKAFDVLSRLGLDPSATALVFGLCLSFTIGAVLLEIAITDTGSPASEAYDPPLAFETGIRRLLPHPVASS